MLHKSYETNFQFHLVSEGVRGNFGPSLYCKNLVVLHQWLICRPKTRESPERTSCACNGQHCAAPHVETLCAKKRRNMYITSPFG